VWVDPDLEAFGEYLGPAEMYHSIHRGRPVRHIICIYVFGIIPKWIKRDMVEVPFYLDRDNRTPNLLSDFEFLEDYLRKNSVTMQKVTNWIITYHSACMQRDIHYKMIEYYHISLPTAIRRLSNVVDSNSQKFKLDWLQLNGIDSPYRTVELIQS
jgi:hypothetical protein